MVLVQQIAHKGESMKLSEKIVGLVVAALFVGCLIFETSMVMAVAHAEPFGMCKTCETSGGGF